MRYVYTNIWDWVRFTKKRIDCRSDLKTDTVK